MEKKSKELKIKQYFKKKMRTKTIHTSPIALKTLELQEMKNQLIQTLDLCDTHITKKSVACSIITNKGNIFWGFNVEQSKPLRFVHAEEMAIKNMAAAKDDSGIKYLFMAGKGQYKVQLIVPCGQCCEKIIPLLSKNSKIILFQPDSLERTWTITSSKLINANKAAHYLELEGKT